MSEVLSPEGEVHRGPVRIARVGKARQLEQREGVLGRAPARRLDPEPPAQGPRHRARFTNAEGVEAGRVLGESAMPQSMRPAAIAGQAQELVRRLAPRARERDDAFCSLLDPGAVA